MESPQKYHSPMSELSIWRLICYRLLPRDILTVFLLSKSHLVLSKQRELWSVLLNRDFPEHYAICESKPDQWYKDLYQYGAYFIVDSFINLYPRKILYTAFAEHARWGVLTGRRGKGVERSYLRRPFENYVGVSRLEDHKTVDSTRLGYRSIPIPNANLVFIASSQYDPTSPNRYNLCPLKRYESRRWKPVLEWLNCHFEIETLDVQILQGNVSDLIPDHTGVGVLFYFRGQLREGWVLSLAAIDPRDIEISNYLSEVVYPYALGCWKTRDVEHDASVYPSVIKCSNPIDRNTPLSFIATRINDVQIPIAFDLRIPPAIVKEV